MGSATIPRVFSFRRTQTQAHLDRLDRAVTYSQHAFLLCKVRDAAINVAITKHSSRVDLQYRTDLY